ncbi:hypothetical protein H5410_050198, partial [Solanum commersonii]
DLYTKNVEKTVDKLATIIPLFLASTLFYGERLEIYPNKLPANVDKPQYKLKAISIKNMPQQDSSSSYVFLSYCVFDCCGLYEGGLRTIKKKNNNEGGLRNPNIQKRQKNVIVVCTHVYLLNTSVMEFLICVLLISMQSIIVKGMPQSYDIMEK